MSLKHWTSIEGWGIICTTNQVSFTFQIMFPIVIVAILAVIIRVVIFSMAHKCKFSMLILILILIPESERI